MDSTVVRLDTEEGPVGWGETCPFGPNYLEAFAAATDRFMEIMGCDADYIASGGSYFTAETHIRHLDEVHAGAVIEITTRVILGAGKKMHL